MKLITNKEQSKEAAIFLLNRYYGYLEKSRLKRYPNTIAYYKSINEILMSYDIESKIFWVRYDEIWSFLENTFDYDFFEIKQIIKIWVVETYNLTDFIVKPFNGQFPFNLE